MPDDVDLISRYQELVQYAADVITYVDPNGVIEYQSPAVERVLGYDQEALVGEPAVDYVHQDDREEIASAIAAALESPPGTVHEMEYRFRHADGSWVILESRAGRRSDDEGFVVTSRDVTEHRRAVKALEHERTLYETVVDQVNDAIIIVRDPDVVFANDRARELLGYDEGDLVGQRGEELIAPADRDRVEEYLTQRADIDQPDPPSRYEARFLTRDGDVLVGEVNVARISYRGEPASLVAVHDVTERRRREARLEELTTELEVLNRVVRHDVRNDVAVILGWAELMEDHVDEDGQAHLERILSSGEHVVEITEHARDLIETLTGDGTADLRPVPLGSVLETEVALRRESSPAATFHVDDLPDVAVQANGMLASVFTNLLHNAVQHNPSDEPTIWVSVDLGDGSAVVRIADDGPGIPDDRKEEVFGKGEHGLDSPGTGIGLYVVRRLVEAFGGAVHVEDRHPEGSVFVVRLPLVE